jgi:hypothetical protein
MEILDRFLAGYTDADWVGNAADRRYAFSIGSAAVVWSSKKQPTVALSSTEAEGRGAAVAKCKAIWLKRLLNDLHEEVSDPTVIYCNNLSSIQLAKNLVFHALQTKHIEVHCHFVRERVLSGEVELQYVPTDRQIADIFTKPLGLDKLRQFSGALGLRHLGIPNLRGREETKPNNSDSESQSEKAETEKAKSEKAKSDHRFDSDTLNQPRPKRTRRTQRKRQRHDSKEAEKGRVSKQADQKGRCYAEI